MRRRLPAMLVALVIGSGLAACGGDDRGDGTATAVAAYANEVSTISTAMERRLAELSDRADYRRAAAAAASTRQYAASIREAAKDLRAVRPPEGAKAQHAALVALYDRTATSLDALAARFAAAPDAAELGVLAQELSSAVQQYASQEQELRAAIQRALVAATSPAAGAR